MIRDRAEAVIEKIARERGFQVVPHGEDEYFFAKGSANGTISLKKCTDDTATIFFTYTNSFDSTKMNMEELLRYKGTNNLSNLCGTDVKIMYLSPSTLHVCAKNTFSVGSSNLSTFENIVGRDFFVAEKVYEILNCETYYKKTAQREYLEKEFTGKLRSRGTWTKAAAANTAI